MAQHACRRCACAPVRVLHQTQVDCALHTVHLCLAAPSALLAALSTSGWEVTPSQRVLDIVALAVSRISSRLRTALARLSVSQKLCQCVIEGNSGYSNGMAPRPQASRCRNWCTQVNALGLPNCRCRRLVFRCRLQSKKQRDRRGGISRGPHKPQQEQQLGSAHNHAKQKHCYHLTEWEVPASAPNQ